MLTLSVVVTSPPDGQPVQPRDDITKGQTLLRDKYRYDLSILPHRSLVNTKGRFIAGLIK